MNTTSPALVLASTSAYRRTLLERLRLPFDCQPPGIDETALPGESPHELVSRLAAEKARAVAERCAVPSLVIGSDQVAVLDREPLGKPGSRAAAVRQLQRMRGCRIEFLTGLCVVNTATRSRQLDVVPFAVTFRNYDDQEIERYVSKEEPLDCAGGFRSEALGISLVESLNGSDPTALIGLPLIRLTEMLRREGMEIP